MIAKRLFLVAAMLSAVSGCTTGWARRGVELPVELPESDDTADQSLDLRWWETFGEPDLDDAVTLALGESFTVRAARARVAQAEALSRQAGSALYPSVEVGASAARVRTSVPFTGAEQSSRFSLSASAGWELDVWGRASAGREAARMDVEATRADVAAARLGVAVGVVEAWLDAAYAAEQAALLERQIAIQERFLEILRLRLSSASTTALDIEQQSGAIDALHARASLVQAVADTARLRLAALQGRLPADLDTTFATELPPLPAAPRVAISAALLSDRPDLVAAYARATAADARMAQAIADRLPSIRLSGSLFFEAGSVANLFDEVFWNLVAGITAPVFDGGRRRAEVDRARAALDERVLTYANAVVQAVVEVETALALERAQTDYLGELSERESSAARAVELAREQYREGVADYLRVLTTSTALETVQQERLDARRQLLSYRIQLHRALGGGWPDPDEP